MPNVLFVEPVFPDYQRHFVRALKAMGAFTMVISKWPLEEFDPELRSWVDWHWRVDDVTDEGQLEWAAREAMRQHGVDFFECSIEAQVLPVARVRERLGLPGLTSRQAWICRDKPTMKDVLRAAGVPTAASAAAESAAELRDAAARIGFPIIVKPSDGAGAAGTFKVHDAAELERVLPLTGVLDGARVAVEEFVDGTESFIDTLTVNGEVTHDFITHYEPNILPAMRSREISPLMYATNRIDDPQYDDVRALSRAVIEALGLDTTPTHMEYFSTAKGLRFSEIGARPPGVGQWDVYNDANEFDIYRDWASARLYGRVQQRLSRRYTCGVVAIRPERDGHVTGYSGVEEMWQNYGDLIQVAHLPGVGSPTQPVEYGFKANAWIRLRHEDEDACRRALEHIGRLVTMHAA